MIDIKKAKEVFKNYVQNYDPNDEKVKLKIAHIERTSAVAKETAQYLKLTEEDILLAELIGLLHDIGRFEQIKRYHTFVDKISVNHGEFGVKILFNDGLITKFIKDRKYDEIIKKAILNHNRGKIEEGLNEKELLHSKIIRDSDKTDIFYTLTFGDVKAIWEKEDFSEDKISEEIYREFMEDKAINYKNRITSADILVSHFAYVYDFNFNYGLKLIYNNGYIDKLFNRFRFKDQEVNKQYIEIYKTAKEYVKNKVNALTYHNAKDGQELATKIKEFMGMREAAKKKIVEQGYITATKYDVTKIHDKLVAIFGEKKED